jgi:uncharacterized protein
MIELNINDGWHINAHQPLQKNLIATVVSLEESQWQLGPIYYPNPKYQRLSWQQSTLALYEDTVRLHGKLQIPQIPPNSPLRKGGTSKNLVPIKLTFQACDDKSCLPPEEIIFKMFIAKNRF